MITGTKEVEGKTYITFKVREGVEFNLSESEVTELSRGIRLRTLESGEEVSFDNLRLLRRDFRKLEREYKRGKLVHMSKIFEPTWKQINEEYYKEHGTYPTQKGYTYTKSEDTK